MRSGAGDDPGSACEVEAREKAGVIEAMFDSNFKVTSQTAAD